MYFNLSTILMYSRVNVDLLDPLVTLVLMENP